MLSNLIPEQFFAFTRSLLLLLISIGAVANPLQDFTTLDVNDAETSKSIECFIAADLASGNHVRSMKLYGDLLRQGEYCEKDLGKSIYWYKKAYELSDKSAGLALANIYLTNGNENKGLAILEELSASGMKDAIYELGIQLVLKGDVNTAAKYLQHPILVNDPDALGILGLLYFNPDFLGHDSKKGLELTLRAADLGHNFSKFAAGEELVKQGNDVEKGLTLLKEAALGEFPVPDATTFLSKYYRANQVGNKKEALYWSIRSAANGDKESYSFVKREVKLQQQTLLNDDSFFDFLCAQMEHLAADEFVPAMDSLGLFYEFGEICAENRDRALFWYEEAYKRGSVKSGYELASSLRQDSSERSHGKSLAILKKLADSGHVAAANDFGVLIEQKGDFERAKYYYELAARKGLANAFNNLGWIYLNEKTAVYSPKLALEVFHEGASTGDVNSQYHYGRLLLEQSIDAEKGFALILDAANLGDAQAQFSVGLELSDRYGKMYAPSEAKYWFLRSILSNLANLSNSANSKKVLSTLYKTTDKHSNDYYISTSLLSQLAEEGIVDSAVYVASIFLTSEEYQKAHYYLELALWLTTDNSSARLELLNSHYDVFIKAAKVLPEFSQIENLFDDYLELAKINSHSLQKPYYAKYQYYLQVGDESQSKINLSLAIQHTDAPDLKRELLAIYQSKDIDDLEDFIANPKARQLSESVDKLYAGEAVDFSELTKSFKEFKPMDLLSELTYLVALENFASYLLYNNEFEASARISKFYVDYIDASSDYFGNSQRNDKMKILALLPHNYEVVSKMLDDYSKYNQLKSSYSNFKIVRLMLQSKLNIAHGYNEKAKQSLSSAFTIFADAISSEGVCYDDFALDPEQSFQYFSESELFTMAKRFSDSLNDASNKYSIGFLRKNCGEKVREASNIILLLLKDEHAENIRKTWFNVLLSTYLYEDLNSQKKTLVNLATLNRLVDQDERKKFKEYLSLTRALDDKLGQNLASKHESQSGEVSTVNSLSELTQLSQKIKQLENEFHSSGGKNPLSPYLFENYSVANIQSNIMDNEAVVILSAYGDELIGFYVDKSNFDIVTTTLSKSRYDALRHRILSSVEQDDISSPLDLRPFAYAEAFELYNSFFQNFDQLSVGKKRILVTYHGVEPVPLSIIPTSPLQSSVKTALDFGVYRNTEWFMDGRDLLYLANVNMLFSERSSVNEQLEVSKSMGITPYWDDLANQFSLPRITQGLISQIFQGEKGKTAYESLPPLNESIKHVEALTNGKETTMLLGRNASKERITTALASDDHDIIVFSTHALANTSRVDMPSLVIKSEDGIGYDLLTAGDISQITISADWVFLIGCNTGRTNFKTDFLSLAESFILAGVKRVVMTDWPIESRATTKFTQIFQNLPQSTSFTQKISLAQSKLRNARSNVVYAHPMFWGGFRVIGSL